MNLFGRRYKLTLTQPVDAFGEQGTVLTEITELRVTFEVRKSLKKEPNTATIEITNLERDKREHLAAKGLKVQLVAGYENDMGLIYYGDARTVEHIPGPDWITKIECGDGERAYRHARINASFRAGTKPGQVALAAAQAMGLGVGNLTAVAADLNKHGVYLSGFAAFGQASTVIDQVLASAGYEWSVQDGQVQAVRLGASLEDRIVLAPDSGLVGSPELAASPHKKKPPQLTAKSLLRWQMRPGAVIDLQSDQHSGSFKILSLTQTGDSQDPNRWHSDIVGQAVTA